MRLKLPDGVWTNLTLTLDDVSSRPIPITGVVLHEADSAAPLPELVATTISERIESNGETRLTVNLGAAHVPLAGLKFHTGEPLFTRRVSVLTRQWENGEVRERLLGSGTIYRVAVDGQATAEQLDLTLDLQPPTRDLVLAIDNGDSPPLAVEAVEAIRPPMHLVFLARQSGAFQLFSGNPRVAAPRYDVAELSSQLKSANVALVRLGSISGNPDFRPSEPLPEIPLFAATLDVEPWSFRRVVKTGAGAVQQLELTPHVLAYARDGLRDVRLVAAGKQIPFIVERAGFTRALTPEVSRADDEKRPRLSRWAIRLPQARLPITKLSCETKATLFQREVQVSEELANGRGERHWRGLGSASWVRRPDSKSGRFNVTLNTPPQTETLVLQIDNGDNPALDLEKFQVFLPVIRLLFKAPPGETVTLCYGNAKAVAPSYDLDLVAPQILAAAKSDATLADADPDGPAIRATASKGISYVFFGVLALVVGVLLVVIMRLLPKPGN